MKINDFKISTTALLVSLESIADNASKALVSATANNESKDEIDVLKASSTAASTRLKYAKHLTREKLEKNFAKILENQEMMSDITSDSYSLSKLADIVESITFKRSVKDFALNEALKHLSSVEFKHITHNALRMNMMSQKDATKCHATDRQSSMICKLFERLNVATRKAESDCKKATLFDKKSFVISELSKVYS